MIDLITMLKRQPSYRRLWFGDVISLLGNWLSFVAISMLALEKGEGAIAIALVFVAHNLPYALFAPIAGTLTDRFDRRTLMLRANDAQGALTLVMAAAAAFEQIAIVQILLFVRISLSAFFVPAHAAAIPRTVGKKEDLTLANALSSATGSVAFGFGVALGGMFVAFAGVTLAILADASTFFFANLFIRRLPALPPIRSENEKRTPRLRDAWVYALSNKNVLEAVLAKTPLAFASGAAWVALVESTHRIALFTAGATTLGLLNFARAFGSSVGPALTVYLKIAGVSGAFLRSASFAVTLAGIALLAASEHGALTFFGAVVWGIGISANWVRAQTKLQSGSPDGLMGRLSAIDFFSFTLASSVGALAGAIFMERSGLPAGAAWLGIAGCFVLWFLLFSATRDSRQGKIPC